jgi:hypothetical protein
LGRYAPYALPEEFIEREYGMCTRRELHRSVRLRLVWDFLVEVCSIVGRIKRYALSAAGMADKAWDITRPAYSRPMPSYINLSRRLT